MAAFSVFFMQSPSFLSHQRVLESGRGRSNCQTLFGMDKIPTDNHIRKMLDPVKPDHLFPLFSDALEMLSERGGLEAFRRLVYAFYTPDFSFATFVSKHPEHREAIVRVLIGDVFGDDLDDAFRAMGTMCDWAPHRDAG